MEEKKKRLRLNLTIKKKSFISPGFLMKKENTCLLILSMNKRNIYQTNFAGEEGIPISPVLLVKKEKHLPVDLINE